MKKLTKILSVIIAMLILNNNVYAADDNILTKISKELGGFGKIIAMVGTVVVIAIIIYLAYRGDKKEELERAENDVVEDDYSEQSDAEMHIITNNVIIFSFFITYSPK